MSIKDGVFEDKTVIITKEQQRAEAVKEITSDYASSVKWPIITEKGLYSQLCRLIDYCVDDVEDGYAFPEWLTEREKMQIIYKILDKCKNYLKERDVRQFNEKRNGKKPNN